MAQTPTNAKLWAMVVAQAKAKYHPYPSPGASAWVHKRYMQLGGAFQDSSDKTAREKLQKRQFESKKKHLGKSTKDKD